MCKLLNVWDHGHQNNKDLSRREIVWVSAAEPLFWQGEPMSDPSGPSREERPLGPRPRNWGHQGIAAFKRAAQGGTGRQEILAQESAQEFMEPGPGVAFMYTNISPLMHTKREKDVRDHCQGPRRIPGLVRGEVGTRERD